ncbi:MAG: hypothetical protein MUF85_00470 [Patescibacteria group bacterium]|jgi:hypothetical protein|nr:hypothetical protein [Patescibacteria group bacterium]
MTTNKPIAFSIITLFVSVLSILLITATRSPGVDNYLVIFTLVFLIYIASTSFIFIVLYLLKFKSVKTNLMYAMLLGCFPPAVLILLSIRQANAFDIIILLTTVMAILGYINYKS